MAMPNHIFRFNFIFYFSCHHKRASHSNKWVSAKSTPIPISSRLPQATGKINLFILCGRKRKSNDTTRHDCTANEIRYFACVVAVAAAAVVVIIAASAMRYVLSHCAFSESHTRTQLNECNVFDVNDYDMIWKCDSIFSHVGSSHASDVFTIPLRSEFSTMAVCFFFSYSIFSG